MTEREKCMVQARAWLEPVTTDSKWFGNSYLAAANRAEIAKAWMMLADRSSPNPPATKMAPVIPTGTRKN